MSVATGQTEWAGLGAESSDTRAEAGIRYRPTAHSIPSMDRLKRLLRHYDLGDDIQGELFVRGVNDTFILSTPTRQLALKAYRARWRTQEALMQELAALQHLFGKGIAVPLPLARNDGKLISKLRAPEGLRQLVLSPWASGCMPRYSNTFHARQFGEAVAKMHSASDDFHFYSARPRMDMDYLFRRSVQTIQSRLKNQPRLAARFDGLAQRIENRIRRVESKLPDWGFCHGDVTADNASIDGDQLAIFDFDFCGPGWRVFELATFRWHARVNDLEQLAWNAFLDGYQQVRPATASLPFVELFMMLRHLWNQAQVIELSGHLGAVRVSQEFLDGIVSFCEQLEAECVNREN